MKTMGGTRRMNSRGFSLLEMLVVLALLAVLMGMSGAFYQTWTTRYKAEAQVKTMHAEIMQTRLKAMEKNRQHFAVLNGSVYQIVEDTNDSGEKVPDSPPDVVLTSKTLIFPSSSNVTLTMDTKGIISTPTSTLSSPLSIQFSTGAASPEYDCFLVYATRISIGKMNGAACVTK